MHLFKKYLNFSNKINVPSTWGKMYQNIVNSLDCLKGIAVLDWWKSSQRFKRHLNISGNFTYLSPAVNLKMMLKSPKLNLTLVLIVHPCQFAENPSIGSRDIQHARL